MPSPLSFASCARASGRLSFNRHFFGVTAVAVAVGIGDGVNVENLNEMIPVSPASPGTGVHLGGGVETILVAAFAAPGLTATRFIVIS